MQVVTRCRAQAEECMRLAVEMEFREHRAALFRMADLWIEVGDEFEALPDAHRRAHQSSIAASGASPVTVGQSRPACGANTGDRPT